MSEQTVSFENLRSLAYTGISGTYAAVGSALSHQARIICITNATDGGMIFSIDPTNSAGQLYLAAGTFKLFDLTTNRVENQKTWVLPPGTQFYVKQDTSPTARSVYIEVLY